MAQEFTKDNFESDVLKSEQPVLVDFWAEWCGPCKMIGPMVEAVATEVDGVAKVGKVNVDSEQELAREYKIQSIPTLLFFKNGEIADTIVGANITQDGLREKLEALA
ncbi:MAG: thioredoxin [Akkermansiaceae bacterium]|nr:thioredoxin [Akkermansiaceae bacterium]NNM30360.1 thioredoxin [Akkermansiaceae bacterium]